MCNYYESNAEHYAAETFSADMSEQYQSFLPLLKKRAKILDVGSGSGRDAYYFQRHGYEVTALEPSKNLCREIQEILCFFKKIDMYLNDNGIVYASGKSGISTGEVEDGRFFLEFTEQLVQKMLTVNEQLKLEQLWYTQDVSGREGFQWMNVIFKLF